MTTKAQDIVIDEMADEGTVFVEPLRIGGRVYATIRVCVLNHRGRRLGPWWLVAEDGATMSLPEESGEQVVECCSYSDKATIRPKHRGPRVWRCEE